MPYILNAGRISSIAIVGTLLTACSAPSGLESGPSPGLPVANGARAAVQAPRIQRGSSSSKIQHVVIIIQENRSFNNLFYGYPGAKTVRYGRDSNNQAIKLVPIPLEARYDIEHDSSGFFAACNGTGSIPGTNCQMNGFDKEWVTCGGSSNPCPTKHPQYVYVPSAESGPYLSMAQQYVLADRMYASNFDGSSFVAHQYAIAAQSEQAVNYPWIDVWGCPGGPTDMIYELGPQRQMDVSYEVVCWDPTTLADELDAKGLPWAYYAWTVTEQSPGGQWSAYQAINHIYNGLDWSKDVISPQTQFFNDVQNGNLRAVTWITPTCENSDHPGCLSNTGPSWVASLVNAVGESQYWDSTAIFVFWDDPGGLYDPEPPAYVDYDGLGMRIPMLIISPYAKQGYVSHVHYEFGSILKFVENTFKLGRLSASDTRANSPARDSFDFTQSPRSFVPIQAPYSRYYFKHQPPDSRPPDWQ